MELADLFQRLGIALGLGLLVGLQRERAVSRLAGFRTFPLVTLLGGLCGLLDGRVGGWLLASGLVGLSVIIVAGNLPMLKGEEEAVIRAFNRVRTAGNHALLVIAPRHPERFAEVERLAVEHGFSTARRSQLPIDADPRVDVVVLDTLGELAQLYQLATAVFVGGSLADYGGHNILEPAVFGKPIVFGSHMQNFKEIAETFLANGAAVQVHSDRELDDAMRALVMDPVRRARLGAAARALVEANRGAKDKTLAVLSELLPPTSSVVRPFRLVH